MELTTTRTLTAIFSEVLANLAFLFTDDEETEPALGEVWLETSISYHGPVSGTLRFRCTRSFCELLAANLLGIDPDDEAAARQSEDAVREFMNIVCGQFVTSMHGSDDVYNLSIPHTVELPETPDLADDGGKTSSTLSVDHHVVQLIYEPK
ncbi:MAG TPA: chemotaxis protein CheX [Phycisphaerae bacterium]|nr:chemotaxis protein CheX [Phycisphaerae bacterium]HOJ73096.1 chemotaxis protein CheX [Phycisphaerae bacterium]HOM52712.1 chemotaxis protein CheX [Phycisphaerae bacterium]HON68365.1 chemotaxis protein CheX [Phycisphaerae bacterium]HOQ87124.1 chemotaxis protein CheX [Phycisphaerae bacterium]